MFTIEKILSRDVHENNKIRKFHNSLSCFSLKTYRLPIYPAYTLYRCHTIFFIYVQLQSCLYEPNGIRECACHETSTWCWTHMYNWWIRWEDIIPKLFRLRISTKIYCPRWRYTDEIRTQTYGKLYLIMTWKEIG